MKDFVPEFFASTGCCICNKRLEKTWRGKEINGNNLLEFALKNNWIVLRNYDFYCSEHNMGEIDKFLMVKLLEK